MARTLERTVVAGRELELTNLEKGLWPEDGFTKAHFLRYLSQVAPYMLPHLAGRPLVVTRYPDGIHGESFYQKDCPTYAPPWIRTFSHWARDSGRWLRFILCDDLPTLLWVGNQAAIELHPWLSPASRPDTPDFAVFDLDPAAPAGFEEARRVAFLVQVLLKAAGLRGYPKTSGATGLHIHVPLVSRYTYHQAAGFIQQCGRLLLQAQPDLITLERAVKKRTGRVYVDYLQNARGKTVAGPYSARPLPGAPVACPLTWEEVATVQPAQHTILTVPGRLSRRGDPFAATLTDRQELEPASKALGLPPP